MPLTSRMRHRLLAHHLPLFLASVAALALIAERLLEGSAPFRWSMATAYVALALLAAAMCVGPWTALRRGRAPLSNDLRRDLGIWAGVVSLAHVAVGLQVHMGSMLLYFVIRSADGSWTLRRDAFGLANWVGLVSTCILLLLLALSNDWSLRRLGRQRWKAMQRSTYAAAILLVLHGAVYQLLERRHARWVLLFALVVVVVAVAQSLGFRRLRTRLP